MSDLAHVLRRLPHSPDPNLLVGGHFADDAAVYRLTDEVALVQTVDFFTPIVDDPYTYGQIAVANSLSDVYAMGGSPLTALNIVGFPVKTLSHDILAEILRGGANKAGEAGVTIVGGHTVDDEEPKYGLAVTGTVHPGHFVSAHGARSGDVLLLTKPLGTGTIATALKAGEAAAHHVEQAVRWMTTLNRTASEAMVATGAHAATDVTGYGLLGHLLELCRASSVSATVSVSAIPALPGAREYIRDGLIPGGTKTNLEGLGADVKYATEIDDEDRWLLADPQTSGGLLIVLAPDQLDDFRRASDPTALTAIIGSIEGENEGLLIVSR